MFCDGCGTRNRDVARFCRGCGQTLAGPVDEVAQARRADGEEPSESPTLLPAAPRRLAERYVLGEIIGAGGMGFVYRGHDPSLDRPVAIKILRPEYSRDPSFVERFLKEARIAARLRHPHIVSIHEVGESDLGHYYVMDFIDGDTLHAVVKRGGALPFDAAARVLLEIGRAVAFAHESGILHRDLKPENAMIDREGNVVVMDFGLARAADDPRLTRVGTIVGSPLYMSPEQIRGEPVDHRSDIFSIGLIFFYLLAGRHLFHGDTVAEVIASQREMNIADVLRRTIRPDSARRLMTRLLEREPANRLGDLREMITALKEAAGAQDAHAPRVASDPEPGSVAAEAATRERLRRLLERIDPGGEA